MIIADNIDDVGVLVVGYWFLVDLMMTKRERNGYAILLSVYVRGNYSEGKFWSNYAFSNGEFCLNYFPPSIVLSSSKRERLLISVRSF